MTTNNSMLNSKVNSISLEELLLRSDLFAGMARADGKILDIENVVAETYFEQNGAEDSNLVKSHYNYVVQDDETDLRMCTVMGFMSKLPVDEKYKLMRCLSTLAICDGNLHPKEVSLIKQFAKAMEIDISGI